MIPTVENVVEVLSRYRFRFSDEDQLQEAIGSALAEAGLPVEREVVLDRANRIDFLVGLVGIEVKVAGQAGRVAGQLRRYAASPQVDQLVLVTTRARHLKIPNQIDGTRVEIVSLLEAGL